MADWTLIQGAYQANKPVKPVAPGAITNIGSDIAEAAYNIGVSMEERGAQWDLLAKEIGEMDGLPEDAIDMFTADLDKKRKEFITGGPGDRMKAMSHIEKRLAEAEEALGIIETLGSQSENLSDAYKKSSQGVADLIGLKEGLTINDDGELGYYIPAPEEAFEYEDEFVPTSGFIDKSFEMDFGRGRKKVKGEFVTVKQMQDRFESNQVDDTFINAVDEMARGAMDRASKVDISYSQPFNRDKARYTITNLVNSTNNLRSLLMDRVGNIPPFQESLLERLQGTTYTELGIDVDKDKDGTVSDDEVQALWQELMKKENEELLKAEIVDYYTLAIEKGYNSTLASRRKPLEKTQNVTVNGINTQTITTTSFNDADADNTFNSNVL